MQFRIGGEPGRLDVDTLNERLKHSGALRLRHTQKPDEAFGMIFNFDSVVADTQGAYLQAWRDVAAARGLPLSPHARVNLHGTCPERIIMDVSRLGRRRRHRSARWRISLHQLVLGPTPRCAPCFSHAGANGCARARALADGWRAHTDAPSSLIRVMHAYAEVLKGPTLHHRKRRTNRLRLALRRS